MRRAAAFPSLGNQNHSHRSVKHFEHKTHLLSDWTAGAFLNAGSLAIPAFVCSGTAIWIHSQCVAWLSAVGKVPFQISAGKRQMGKFSGAHMYKSFGHIPVFQAGIFFQDTDFQEIPPDVRMIFLAVPRSCVPYPRCRYSGRTASSCNSKHPFPSSDRAIQPTVF